MPNLTPPSVLPVEEVITEMSAKKIPEWVQKLLAWIVIGLLTGGTALSVVQVRLSGLETRQTQHEVMQQEHEREDVRDKEAAARQRVTVDQFNQFKDDLVHRLDRIENKVDKLQEKR
jgi:hypothetical protein